MRQTPAGASDLKVTHVGGMYKDRRPITIRLEPAGISFLANRRVAAAFTWDQVDRFSFEDPKRTRTNVGAVVLFGALGLGARKDFTLIYFAAAGDRTAWFEVPTLAVQWRPFVDQIVKDIPAARGKVWLADDSTPAPAAADVPTQIEALARLRDQGIVTDEEFTAKKTELLSRM